MNMKRALSLAMAGALSLSLLAGCGGGASETPAPAGSPPAETTPAPSPPPPFQPGGTPPPRRPRRPFFSLSPLNAFSLQKSPPGKGFGRGVFGCQGRRLSAVHRFAGGACPSPTCLPAMTGHMGRPDARPAENPL